MFTNNKHPGIIGMGSSGLFGHINSRPSHSALALTTPSHQHIFLTPVRSPSATSSCVASTSTAAFLSSSSASSFSNHAQHNATWTQSRRIGGSFVSSLAKTSTTVDDGKDKCEHQAAMYRRILCHHCGEMFCDSCEISHKERLKKEVLVMGQTFLSQDFGLDREAVESRAMLVRDHLTKYAEALKKNVESEIATTEFKFQNAARAFLTKLRSDADNVIQKAFELRDNEVSDLLVIGAEASRCQEEKGRISHMMDTVREQQVYFVTMKDMANLHQEIVRLYGLNCAIDALKNCSEFYSDKVLEFSRHPGFIPMLDRCVDFFHTVQLGSVKFSSPIKKIRAMLSGQQNFDISPFKPLICSGSTSLGGSMDLRNRMDFIGKSFYDRMHVVALVSGKDALGWDIRKPFGLVWLTNTEYLAVVHRPKRITLVTINGEVVATYKFADPDCMQAGGLNFHGNLAADDAWKIYFIDEPGLRIFSFDIKSNPFKNRNDDLAVPHVFARLQSCGSRSAMTLHQFSENSSDSPFCNKMKFHGLAVGLARQELYTEAGDSIVAFSLADGSPRFRCLLEPTHQFSSHVLGVIDRPNSISYLIYSTNHGNVLHKKTFLQNGLLEEGSSVIANQGCDMNCVSEVRGVANDPAGNLLLADSKNGCIKVFSEHFQVFSSFGYGDNSTFNPSGVAVAVCGNSQPVVVVTEFSSHRIIFFSA